MDRLNELERELDALARQHPPFPRSWKDEVERRVAQTGWSVEDVVLELREERNLIPPGPVTLGALIEHERRFLALFEPDELRDYVATELVGATER
jgi:hypothetical protein